MEGVGEEKDDKREIEKNCYVTPLLLPSFLPSPQIIGRFPFLSITQLCTPDTQIFGTVSTEIFRLARTMKTVV